MATNTKRRGFFIKPNGDLSPATEFPNCPIPWSKEFIVKINTNTQQRLLHQHGGCLLLAGGNQFQARDYRGTQSSIADSYPITGWAFQVGYKGLDNSGTPAHRFTKDGNDIGGIQNAADDARGWNVPQLIAADYANIYLSWAQFVNNDGLTATYDGNLVPNAAGDGWVSRLQADYGNVVAMPGYERVLYDTERLSSPYDAPAPAGAEWIYDSGFQEDVVEVRAGQKGLSLTFDPYFEPVSAEIDGFPVSIEQQSEGAATLSFPDMGTVIGWSKFGKDLDGTERLLTLTDKLGNQVTKLVDWLPAVGYGYTDLGDVNVTNDASMFYNWGVSNTDYADAEPPTAGNQIVYKLSHYSNISPTGIVTVATDSPGSFTSRAYIVDDEGMQAFNTDSGNGEPVIGSEPSIALNGEPHVTVTVGQGYADEGATWTDSEDGSGTVYSAQVVDGETAEGAYNLPYNYTDTDGNIVSVSRVVNVVAAEANLPTVNQTTLPQTVTVGDQIQVSATASDYDTFQWIADLDGTFDDENALEAVFTTAEHGQLTITAVAENAEGSRSDSVTHTVEDPIAMGEFTATHQNVPDGQIETVVVNLDTSEVLFNGMKSWANGQATFSFENLANGSRIQVSTLNETDQDGGLSVEYAA